MTDRPELKPCPFCGPGQSVVSLWHDDMAQRWRVGCGRCGASSGISPRDKTEAPAIAAWNTRAAAPEGARAVLPETGVLRAALERFDETTADCGETDLPRAKLDGLVAFGYLTRRRAGRYDFEYTLTDAGERALRGDTAPPSLGGEDVPDSDWRLRGYVYASKQATSCAGCGDYKHTPLRVDWMGGYVCLTCIDKELESRDPEDAEDAARAAWGECKSEILRQLARLVQQREPELLTEIIAGRWKAEMIDREFVMQTVVKIREAIDAARAAEGGERA